VGFVVDFMAGEPSGAYGDIKGCAIWGIGRLCVGGVDHFCPVALYRQQRRSGGHYQRAAVTFLAFASLTAIVFLTAKDFSFLRGILLWSGVVAMVLIVAGVIFGFQIGNIFLSRHGGPRRGFYLYDTSNVLHHYSEDRYVAAALELFASVALMLWYVLRLFMSRR